MNSPAFKTLPNYFLNVFGIFVKYFFNTEYIFVKKIIVYSIFMQKNIYRENNIELLIFKHTKTVLNTNITTKRNYFSVLNKYLLQTICF